MDFVLISEPENHPTGILQVYLGSAQVTLTQYEQTGHLHTCKCKYWKNISVVTVPFLTASLLG